MANAHKRPAWQTGGDWTNLKPLGAFPSPLKPLARLELWRWLGSRPSFAGSARRGRRRRDLTRAGARADLATMVKGRDGGWSPVASYCQRGAERESERDVVSRRGRNAGVRHRIVGRRPHAMAAQSSICQRRGPRERSPWPRRARHHPRTAPWCLKRAFEFCRPCS